MRSEATAGAPLEAWSGHDWTNGVQIDELRELDCLAVHTRNSTYEIIVRTPASAEVLVRGGARFPSFTPARLCGSSTGGSAVKRAGIYPGFRMEIETADGRRILTSSVVSIDVDPSVDEH